MNRKSTREQTVNESSVTAIEVTKRLEELGNGREDEVHIRAAKLCYTPHASHSHPKSGSRIFYFRLFI